MMNRKDKMWNLSTVSTAMLIILMLIYLAMTLWSSNRLAGHMEIISGHPFEVVASAGDLKTYVSEMRIRIERLSMHKNEADIRQVHSALDSLYLVMEEPLKRIEELYLGRAEDVEELRAALAGLEAGQDACLEFAARGENGLEEIERYEMEYLIPLYDQALNHLEDIIQSAQSKKVEYGRMAESLRRETLAGSVALMGLMVGTLLLSQHILRRQRRELMLRSQLFDNLSTSIDDAFIIRNIRTEEIYYKALNIERVLGYPVKCLDDIYRGFNSSEVEELRSMVHKDNFESPLTRTMEYVLPNRERRWMTVRIYRTQHMDAQQVISVFTDCTDEMTASMALREALFNAQRANEAKSEFLSRMSHEIRTPLNAVIGMATIAESNVDEPEKVKDCLNKISYSSRHLLMLINDVLDMSKIESEKMSLQKEPFDLAMVTGSFVSTVYAQAKGKGVEFENIMEGFDNNTQYIGDAMRLSQILLNLGSNAVKFTAPGGTVTLTVQRLASKMSTDVLRFIVADTGIGMDGEALECIYKPFVQADSSIAGRYGGTGLGMSITKNLVTLMSGRIEIQSEPGKGTICTVDLPMLRDGTAGAEIKHKDAPAMDAEFLKGRRLLVAEDNELNREILTELLAMCNMKAETAVNGEQALQMFRTSDRGYFDAILMDVQMPVMDGYEATAKIRLCGHPDASRIPVIATTANAFSDDISAAMAAGMNSHVSKPIDIKQLCRVLTEEIA